MIGHGNGRKRRIPIVGACPGEGSFTIRFADLRHGVLPTASSVLALIIGALALAYVTMIYRRIE